MGPSCATCARLSPPARRGRRALNPQPGHFTACGIILVGSRLPPCKLPATLSTSSSSPPAARAARHAIPGSRLTSSRGGRLSARRDAADPARNQVAGTTRLVWPTRTPEVTLSEPTSDVLVACVCECRAGEARGAACVPLVVTAVFTSAADATRSGMALWSSAHFQFSQRGV